MWVFQDPQEARGSQAQKENQDLLAHRVLMVNQVFLDSQADRWKALKETEDPKANLDYQVFVFIASQHYWHLS